MLVMNRNVGKYVTSWVIISGEISFIHLIRNLISIRVRQNMHQRLQ